MPDPKRPSIWTDWRRYAPAGGSLVTHAILGVALVSLLAASTKPRHEVPLPPPPALQVMLIAETPPPPVRQPPPPRTPPVAEQKGEALPTAPRKDPRKNQKSATEQPEDVYIPPSVLAESTIPPGLRGAVESDPCKPKYGAKPQDCATGWTAKLGAIDTVSPRPQAETARFYAEFMVTCAWRVGCSREKGAQLNGARSVVGTLMAAGAASLGGMHDSVDHLQFDPDHRDPGFGD